MVNEVAQALAVQGVEAIRAAVTYTDIQPLFIHDKKCQSSSTVAGFFSALFCAGFPHHLLLFILPVRMFRLPTCCVPWPLAFSLPLLLVFLFLFLYFSFCFVCTAYLPFAWFAFRPGMFLCFI